jgi:hypothetical protein
MYRRRCPRPQTSETAPKRNQHGDKRMTNPVLETQAGYRNRFINAYDSDEVYFTKTFRTKGREYYWCLTDQAGFDWAAPIPAGTFMHGPFRTSEEAEQHQRDTLLPDRTAVVRMGPDHG